MPPREKKSDNLRQHQVEDTPAETSQQFAFICLFCTLFFHFLDKSCVIGGQSCGLGKGFCGVDGAEVHLSYAVHAVGQRCAFWAVTPQYDPHVIGGQRLGGVHLGCGHCLHRVVCQASVHPDGGKNEYVFVVTGYNSRHHTHHKT